MCPRAGLDEMIADEEAPGFSSSRTTLQSEDKIIVLRRHGERRRLMLAKHGMIPTPTNPVRADQIPSNSSSQTCQCSSCKQRVLHHSAKMLFGGTSRRNL